VIPPKPFHPKRTLILATIIIVAGIFMYSRDPVAPAVLRYDGTTMGTRLSIRVVDAGFTEVEWRRLYLRIEQYLRQFNEEMSTYIADSEISLFNQSSITNPYPVSAEFATVTDLALTWAERSGGAFEPTLDPLIELWGFGAAGLPADRQPPDEAAISNVLQRVGYTYIRVPDAFHIQKLRPDVQLNLNAHAKGYAVDRVADLLLEAGASNIYVEIGGDLRVAGTNPNGDAWRLGIEQPDPDAPPGARYHGIAHLTQGALAGSGDYRNFFATDSGEVFAHILDPRTGRPARRSLAAVNVYAPACVTADAVATALIVMGLEEGTAWVESLDDVEALFFVRRPDGQLEVQLSSGFAARTGYALQEP
jgi:FAD:protein FMN transferase